MKSALALFAVLFSSVSSNNASADTSWSEIHAYIDAHALNSAAVTDAVEAELWSESVNGERSWIVTGGAERGVVHGGSLGWPRSGDVIVLPTTEEAVVLAEMIDDFREDGSR